MAYKKNHRLVNSTDLKFAGETPESSLDLTIQEWPASPALGFVKFCLGLVSQAAAALKEDGITLRGLSFHCDATDADGNVIMEPKLDEAGEPCLDEFGEQELTAKRVLNVDMIATLLSNCATVIDANYSGILDAIDASVASRIPGYESRIEDLESLTLGELIQVMVAVYEVNFGKDSSIGKAGNARKELLRKIESAAEPSSSGLKAMP